MAMFCLRYHGDIAKATKTRFMKLRIFVSNLSFFAMRGGEDGSTVPAQGPDASAPAQTAKTEFMGAAHVAAKEAVASSTFLSKKFAA